MYALVVITYNCNEYMSIKKNKKVALDSKAIGRRIREIRGFYCNQRDFGKSLGIGQAQLSKYEKGLSVPTLELLLKLKSYSGRSLDWIVMGGEAE